VSKLRNALDSKKANLNRITQEKASFAAKNTKDFNAQIKAIDIKIAQSQSRINKLSLDLDKELKNNFGISLKQVQAESSYKEASSAVGIAAIKESKVRMELKNIAPKLTEANGIVQSKSLEYQKASEAARVAEEESAQRQQAEQMNLLG
jgi:hypothetical protein